MWWLWGKWQLHWERRWLRDRGGDRSHVSASASWYWHLAECWTGLLDENGWQVCGRAIDQHCAVVVTGNGPS